MHDDCDQRRAHAQQQAHTAREPLARAQVRMTATGMMGMLPSRGKFMEKWVVLVPREPPPDAAPAVRVIHSQLLVYNDHIANQPVAKLWVDGATMVMDRDRYLLKLHHRCVRRSAAAVRGCVRVWALLTACLAAVQPHQADKRTGGDRRGGPTVRGTAR